VQTIGDFAFSGCTGMKSLDLGSGLQTIGGYAFSDCTGLKSVVIGPNVNEIGGGAFSNCSALASVTIGEGVRSIGGFAFGYCKLLADVVIPEGVQSIGGQAFGLAKGPIKCYASSKPSGWDSKWTNNYNGRVVWGYRPPPPPPPAPSKVTVVFDAAGGKPSKATRTLDEGAALGKLPAAKRTGYDLVGWYTQKKGGSKVSASTKAGKAATYYAHWKAKSYKVVLKSAGKTVKAFKRSYQAKLGTLPVPKRKGYLFKGWYTAKKGGARAAASAKVSRAATYHAHWARTCSLVGASMLRLHQQASNASAVTGYLRATAKQPIEYLSKKGGWYKVRQGSKTGYAFKKHLRLA
jgi:uncharacterized repeat protein (TIGR02543 family)